MPSLATYRVYRLYDSSVRLNNNVIVKKSIPNDVWYKTDYLKDRFHYEYLILRFGYPSHFAGSYCASQVTCQEQV